VDKNPADRGGEFSSGFIANVAQTVFGVVYSSGVSLDAAKENKLTSPYVWQLGESGPCLIDESSLEPKDEPRQEPPKIEPPKDEPAKPEPPKEVKTTAGLTFKHVKPGEYSEVYLTVNTVPGSTVSATLTGPGVARAAKMTATASSAGQAKFTWKIVSYGTYSAIGSAGNADFFASVVVN
jgi:hypothetical protein